MFNFQKGISLIIVLWMLVILTIIALAFGQNVRTEVTLAGNYQNQAKAQALAEAGIWRATAMALNKAATQHEGERIHFDGHIYQLDSQHGELEVSLQSSSGLIDLNRSPEALIRGLITTIADSEQAETITDSLLDWRDEDDLKRLSGAERKDYISAGKAYFPKNGPMNSVAELARTYGMTDGLYQQLVPLTTVYSGQARIDINTAPKKVLLALPGMTMATVESILTARAVGDDNLDLSFMPIAARKYIGVSQNRFIKISSYAKINNTISGIIAEIDFRPTSEKPLVVLSWRQGLDNVFKDRTDELGLKIQ